LVKRVKKRGILGKYHKQAVWNGAGQVGQRTKIERLGEIKQKQQKITLEKGNTEDKEGVAPMSVGTGKGSKTTGMESAGRESQQMKRENADDG